MRNRYFPFHALGFRCNPFRALTKEEWAQVAVLPEELTPILDSNFVHIQILGETGRGKTTTLLGMAAYFSRQKRRWAYEYLPPGQDKLQTNPKGLEVFLLDEFQRLNRRQQQKLLAIISKLPESEFQLIMGSHKDLASLFEKYDLPLATISLERVSPAHLAAILERRLAFFSLDETSGVAFSADAVHYLQKTYGSNLRAMELFLYNVFQDLQAGNKITESRLREAAMLINPDGEPE